MPFVLAALTNVFYGAVKSTLFPYSFWLGKAFFSQLKIKIATEFIFISWVFNSCSISHKLPALSQNSSA